MFWIVNIQPHLPRVVNSDGSGDNKPREIPNLFLILLLPPSFNMEQACVDAIQQQLEPLVIALKAVAWLVQLREIRRGANPGRNNTIAHLKTKVMSYVDI